jgi:hypothetical protein
MAESEATHQEWCGIVAAAKVSGIQVHDARLAASMHAHEIENLLTLNAKDFRRLSGISVLSPEDVFGFPHPEACYRGCSTCFCFGANSSRSAEEYVEGNFRL